MSCSFSETSSSNEQTSDVDSMQFYGASVVVDTSALPTCDSILDGQIFFILAEKAFQFCSKDDGFQSIDLRGSDGTDGLNGLNGINGINGTNGTSFYSGMGIPASDLGANGDTYLDTYRTAYYLKTSGIWTLQSFNPSHSFQDSRDGHLYKKVNIGSQTWMAENLAYLPSVNTLNDSSIVKIKYYVYNYDSTDVTMAKNHVINDMNYYTTYGVLYNWYAALEACPSGWHLPDTTEWNTLKTYVGGNSLAGNKLKGTSINSFAIGKSSEIDASRGELLSDIRDYEGRDAGETLARIASP